MDNIKTAQTEDYEGKFKKTGFMIKDLFDRYKNIKTINNGNSEQLILTYRTIIKNNLHKDIIYLKEWLDKKYHSKEKTPLGTFIHQKFGELEDKLGNGDVAEKKQNILNNILSEICDSLPEIKYNLI